MIDHGLRGFQQWRRGPAKGASSIGRFDRAAAGQRPSLANCKIPRHVEFLETELPKNGTGKVLKRLLRARFWAHEAQSVS